MWQDASSACQDSIAQGVLLLFQNFAHQEPIVLPERKNRETALQVTTAKQARQTRNLAHPGSIAQVTLKITLNAHLVLTAQRHLLMRFLVHQVLMVQETSTTSMLNPLAEAVVEVSTRPWRIETNVLIALKGMCASAELRQLSPQTKKNRTVTDAPKDITAQQDHLSQQNARLELTPNTKVQSQAKPVFSASLAGTTMFREQKAARSVDRLQQQSKEDLQLASA